MSSYYLKAKHKKTGKISDFLAIDDYFGKHAYGYKDDLQNTYTQEEFDKIFERIEENKVEDCQVCGFYICKCPSNEWIGGGADEVKDRMREDWEVRFNILFMPREEENNPFYPPMKKFTDEIKDFITQEQKANEDRVKREIEERIKKTNFWKVCEDYFTPEQREYFIKTITDK